MAWSAIQNPTYRYYAGESLLDIIRKKIKALKDYKPERDRVNPVKPLALGHEHTYTSGR